MLRGCREPEGAGDRTQDSCMQSACLSSPTGPPPRLCVCVGLHVPPKQCLKTWGRPTVTLSHPGRVQGYWQLIVLKCWGFLRVTWTWGPAGPPLARRTPRLVAGDAGGAGLGWEWHVVLGTKVAPGSTCCAVSGPLHLCVTDGETEAWHLNLVPWTWKCSELGVCGLRGRWEFSCSVSWPCLPRPLPDVVPAI